MTLEECLAQGVVEDMPSTEYHSLKAIGSSALKKFHNCPSTCFDEIVTTDDMNLGSAQDAYSLVSPEYFKSHFIVAPDFGDQRKTENKQKKAEFCEMAEGLNLIVLPATVKAKSFIDEDGTFSKEIPTMKAIEDVDNFLFKEHPMTKRILRTGGQQVSMFWKDEDTGLPCKSRLDHFPDPEFRSIFDLKKCAQIARFPWQIEELRYFLQAGHYSVGAERNNIDVEGFGFIAFNFGDPPQVRIVTIDDSETDYFSTCKYLSKITIRLISECQKANKWPRYPIPFETLSMENILGLPTKHGGQLTPFMIGEIARMPFILKALSSRG